MPGLLLTGVWLVGILVATAWHGNGNTTGRATVVQTGTYYVGTRERGGRMADSISCDGNRVTWYQWRRRRQWYFLYLSDDDRQELNDLLHQISQFNMQDLQNRFDAATCDPPACQKRRTSFDVADPRVDNSYIRHDRPIYTIGLAVRATVFARHKVDVWCEG